jgi:hypothetical protein
MAEWLSDLAVGQWFKADGEPFEIVGVDPKAEIVLVQYFDGTLEELDFDTWMELAAQACAPPEDYSGALDIEREDYGLDRDDGATHPVRWDNPLDLIDSHGL